MLTRQEKRTQKKVLTQRDEARSVVDGLKAEIERLQGDVRVLAGEEIRRVERDFNAQLAAMRDERDKAIAEREALLKNFEGALTAKLDEVRAELVTTQAQFQNAQTLVVKLVARNTELQSEVDEARAHWNAGDKAIVALKEELGSLKMEDAKHLRKRLQAKTERCEALERENEQLKKAPRPQVVPTSQIALQNLLSSSLRRRLKTDAPSERAPETTEPAAPAGAAPTQP